MLQKRFRYERTRRFCSIQHDSPLSPEATQVYLNVGCKYTSEILSHVIQNNHSCIIVESLFDADPNKPLLQFCDFEYIEWDNVLNGKHMASSYLIRKGLSRKAQLAIQIKKYLSKHSSSILRKAVPYTIILDTWDAFEDMKMNFGNGISTSFDVGVITQVPLRERLEWTLEHEKTLMNQDIHENWLWILKPSVTNKGADISIIQEWDDILDIMEDVTDIREWVLQKYISNPLLVNGHKFHLRVYILCIGGLKVFVYNNILMLFAAHTYDPIDITDVYKHLTNTAKSVEDESFNEENGVQILDDLPKYLCNGQTSSRLQYDEKKATHATQYIRNQIYEITKELFTSFENEYTIFSPMSNCFELYGVDFLVDRSLRVHLLEVNPGPDFKQTGQRLRDVICGLMQQTCELVLGCDLLLGGGGGGGSRTSDSLDDNMSNFIKVYDKQWSAANMKGGMTMA
eukprot:gene2181-4242_t